MTFTLTSSKNDPVKTFTSEDGFIKIIKRPSKATWEMKRYSLFNICGEMIGEFDSFEEAIANA